MIEHVTEPLQENQEIFALLEDHNEWKGIPFIFEEGRSLMVKKESLPLQLECTMLFQSNPHMNETMTGIGTRLGRKSEDLQSIVEGLVQQGILQKSGDESSPLFRYKEPVVTTELVITEEFDRS
ncbi:hypothetical protein GCM10010954_29690 [Halobacillus andaensis]|uniref:Uncharacterized protein n=1 Tax=Halobacillus andaensis TaxID=1176239 RepID=A0A917B9F7_HALAA|nr:hypothetical protein [Halobacillus andaensis]MBP2005073.1 hypothetical protein [Halobacillus andaensis]GGF28675.1 hypothetical protein GCM10010954_29690 [Halobacillus andaensis]